MPHPREAFFSTGDVIEQPLAQLRVGDVGRSTRTLSVLHLPTSYSNGRASSESQRWLWGESRGAAGCRSAGDPCSVRLPGIALGGSCRRCGSVPRSAEKQVRAPDGGNDALSTGCEHPVEFYGCAALLWQKDVVGGVHAHQTVHGVVAKRQAGDVARGCTGPGRPAWPDLPQGPQREVHTARTSNPEDKPRWSSWRMGPGAASGTNRPPSGRLPWTRRSARRRSWAETGRRSSQSSASVKPAGPWLQPTSS